MTKKLKIKFFCPGPERQVMTGGGTRRSRNSYQPESYKHYERDELKTLRHILQEDEDRKRARMLRNLELVNIPSWIFIPAEFGDVYKASKKILTYRSYRFNDIKLLWNDTEMAVEVRFSSTFFERIKDLLQSPGQKVITIDRCKTKVYVVKG